MDYIPKFCALCIDDEETIGFSGCGDTPEEAFQEFISNGEFEDQCADWIAAPGDDVDIYIYSVVDVKESDWPEEAINPKWEWCLDKKVETRTTEAV